MAKKKNNTLLLAAIGAGAFLLFSKKQTPPPPPPTCPPGYYYNGQMCVNLPTGINPSQQPTGGGFFNSTFWSSLPGILQGTQNVIQAAQQPKVGFITYQMRY